MNSIIGSKLMDIKEANFRQLLSRSRKKITSFTQSYCGIVNPNAKCSCAKAVTRAVNAGFANLNYPTLTTSRTHITLQNKLDMLVDRTKGLFQNIPSFDTPEEIWLFNFEKGSYNTVNLSYNKRKGTVKRIGRFKKQRYIVKNWQQILSTETGPFWLLSGLCLLALVRLSLLLKCPQKVSNFLGAFHLSPTRLIIQVRIVLYFRLRDGE